MTPAVATYAPRDPSGTVLYHVIAEHLETFLASCEADPDAAGLPAYVERESYDYLRCGILAHGFLRLGCDTCHKELLVPFSCKRRGFCPSCAGRRMAQMAAHLVEQVLPWVPTRQWVVSVPIPLRYWMASSQDLTAKVHTIIRTTSGQYYVNQAVTCGVPRDQVQPGSVRPIVPNRWSARHSHNSPTRSTTKRCSRHSAAPHARVSIRPPRRRSGISFYWHPRNSCTGSGDRRDTDASSCAIERSRGYAARYRGRPPVCRPCHTYETPYRLPAGRL